MERPAVFSRPVDDTALPALPLPRVALGYFARQFIVAVVARMERGEKPRALAALFYDALAEFVRGHEGAVANLASAFVAVARKRAARAADQARTEKSAAITTAKRLAQAEADAAVIIHPPRFDGERGR